MLPRLACAALLALGCQAAAQDKGALFTDPQDGALDASEWLLDRKGFLPVPVVITEPAVGYGAGAALLFFRESIREAVVRGKESTSTSSAPAASSAPPTAASATT